MPTEAAPVRNDDDTLTRIADLLVDIRVAVGSLERRIDALESRPAGSGRDPRTLDVVEIARRHFAARRMRDPHFGSADLFGEPAWDILLDLFISQSEGRSVSVTAACAASGVPASTAMRWLTVLEEAGLVRKENDIADRRRQRVTLTRQGIKQMQGYLTALAAE